MLDIIREERDPIKKIKYFMRLCHQDKKHWTGVGTMMVQSKPAHYQPFAH